MFRSVEFQHALWVTVKFALLTVPTGLVLGVGLAVLADKYLRGLAVFRFFFMSTIATSVAVASLMWLFLLQPEIGVLANVDWIADLFPVVKAPGLLRDPGTALAAVSASSAWASLGFTFLLVTAGLQGIPRDLHEAAVVDGAGGIRRFWSITLPMLGPTLLFVLIVLTTRAFQAYGEIDLLTRGGPRPEDSTTTITYMIYGTDSIINNNLGLQSASRRAAVPRPAAALDRPARRHRAKGPLCVSRRSTMRDDGARCLTRPPRTTRRTGGAPSAATACSSSSRCSCCSRSTRRSWPP